MKKTFALLMIGLFLASVAGHAQDLKLDDILNSYYKATGIEKMKDWKTVRSTGKNVAQGMEFPFTALIKRPAKVRVEAEVQGNKMIQCFDGTAGWNVIPWSGSSAPQDMNPDEVKNMKEQADLEGPLYNWKEKGHKVELLGKEDMEGSSTYKIKVTKANGDIDVYYIEADSFILLKTSSKIKIQGNETESETFYTGYKDINGVQMAMTISTKIKEQTVYSVVIEKTEVNVDIDDNVFVKPPITPVKK